MEGGVLVLEDQVGIRITEQRADNEILIRPEAIAAIYYDLCVNEVIIELVNSRLIKLEGVSDAEMHEITNLKRGAYMVERIKILNVDAVHIWWEK